MLRTGGAGSLPAELTVTTSGGNRYEIAVPGADEEGCELEYRPLPGRVAEAGPAPLFPVSPYLPLGEVVEKHVGENIAIDLETGTVFRLPFAPRINQRICDWARNNAIDTAWRIPDDLLQEQRRIRDESMKRCPVEEPGEGVQRALAAPLTVGFDSTPIEEVIGFLREVTGSNFTLLLAGRERAEPVTFHMSASLKQILDSVCQQARLPCKAEGAFIVVGTEERISAPTSVRGLDIDPDKQVLEALERPIKLDFDETPIEQVIDFLREVTGADFNLLLEGPERAAAITFHAEAPLEKMLDAISEQAELAWKVKGALIVVGTPRDVGLLHGGLLQELNGVDLAALRLDAKEWQDATVSDQVAGLGAVANRPLVSIVGQERLPVTHAFRTREGSVGILELVRLRPTTKGPRLHMRYKLLSHGARSVAWPKRVYLPDSEESRRMRGGRSRATTSCAPCGATTSS